MRGGGLWVMMPTRWGFLFLLCFGAGCHAAPDPSQRDTLIRQETSRQIGGRVTLTAAEQRLDARLRGMKEWEMTRPVFPPAVHFFKAKPLIEASPIFSLLQKMPKGELSWPQLGHCD